MRCSSGIPFSIDLNPVELVSAFWAASGLSIVVVSAALSSWPLIKFWKKARRIQYCQSLSFQQPKPEISENMRLVVSAQFSAFIGNNKREGGRQRSIPHRSL